MEQCNKIYRIAAISVFNKLKISLTYLQKIPTIFHHSSYS